MNLPTKAFLGTLLGALGSWAPLQAQDHPLVAPYPGSSLAERKSVQFDEFQFPVSKMWDNKFVKTLPLEGKVTWLKYSNPAETSTLQLFRNYESALKQGGMQMLFDCSREECGRGDTHPNIGSFAPGYDTRYLAAKLARPEGDAYIAVNISGYYKATWVTVVEVRSMESQDMRAKAEPQDQAPVRQTPSPRGGARAPEPEEATAAPSIAAPAAKGGSDQVETGIIQGLNKFGMQAKARTSEGQAADIIVEGKVETKPMQGDGSRWRWARSTATVSLKDGRTSKIFARFDASDRQASADYNEAVRRSHAVLAKKVAEQINEAITSYFENQ